MRVSSVGKKIRELREAAGLSAYRLGVLAGINRAQISQVESGRWRPNESFLGAVAPFLKVEPGDLLAIAEAERLGGPERVLDMAKRLGLPVVPASALPRPTRRQPSFRARLEDAMRELEVDLDALAKGTGFRKARILQWVSGEGPTPSDLELARLADFLRLPEADVLAWVHGEEPEAPTPPGLLRYFGAAAAGQGLDLNEGELEQLPAAWVPPQADGYVRACGNSMRAAGIPDGAFVFVRRLEQGETPKDGAVVLAHVGGQGAVIKRYRLWDGKPHLVSEATGTDAQAPIPVKGAVRLQGLVLRVATLQDVE